MDCLLFYVARSTYFPIDVILDIGVAHLVSWCDYGNVGLPQIIRDVIKSTQAAGFHWPAVKRQT